MVIKRKLHDETGRAAYWARQPVRQRIAALEIIRGTTNDSIYVQRPFPKVYRLLKKINGRYVVVKSGSATSSKTHPLPTHPKPRRTKSPSSSRK
jgi:hypothetical protein